MDGEDFFRRNVDRAAVSYILQYKAHFSKTYQDITDHSTLNDSLVNDLSSKAEHLVPGKTFRE